MYYDKEKAIELIKYFTNKNGGQIDKVKLLKLIYLAERYQIRRMGMEITGGKYYAMTFGPVNSEVKDIVESNEVITLVDKETQTYRLEDCFSEYKHLSGRELKTLEIIWNQFGSLRAFELVDITHAYPEWKKFESLFNSKKDRFDMSYLDFFDNPDENGLSILRIKGFSEDPFSESEDVLNYSKSCLEYDLKF